MKCLFREIKKSLMKSILIKLYDTIIDYKWKVILRLGYATSVTRSTKRQSQPRFLFPKTKASVLLEEEKKGDNPRHQALDSLSNLKRPGKGTELTESQKKIRDLQLARVQREKTYGLSKKIKEFIQTRQLARATELFNRLVLEERKVKPSVVLFNTLMGGYAELGQATKAWKLLNRMKKKGLTLDTTSYVILFEGFTNSAEKISKKFIQDKHLLGKYQNNKNIPELKNYMEQIWNIYQGFTTNGGQMTTPLLNCLIKVIGRVGDLETLELVFPSKMSLFKSTKISPKDGKNHHKQEDEYEDEIGDNQLKRRTLSEISPSVKVNPDSITYQVAITSAAYLNASIRTIECYFIDAIHNGCIDSPLINTLISIYKERLYDPSLKTVEKKVILEKTNRIFVFCHKPDLIQPEDLFMVRKSEIKGSIENDHDEYRKYKVDAVSAAFLPIQRYFPSNVFLKWKYPPSSNTHGLFLTICRMMDAFELGIQYFKYYCLQNPSDVISNDPFCNFMVICCYSFSNRSNTAYELFLKAISSTTMEDITPTIHFNMIKAILKGCALESNISLAEEIFKEYLLNEKERSKEARPKAIDQFILSDLFKYLLKTYYSAHTRDFQQSLLDVKRLEFLFAWLKRQTKNEESYVEILIRNKTLIEYILYELKHSRVKHAFEFITNVNKTLKSH